MKFYFKEFLLFSLCFVLFTIIGTLSHEYGHIAVAKALGYETTLHYGSMNYRNEITDEMGDFYKEHHEQIYKEEDFPGKARFLDLENEYKKDRLWVRIGGPAQTIFTGLVGLGILFLRRKKIKKNGLQLLDWLAVFLGLFWLREVFNLVHSVADGIVSESDYYFGGDEAMISYWLDWHYGTLSIILGLLGLLVSVFIVFGVVPKKLRLTFILAGLVGGISGFILWLHILGPIVLP